MHELDRAMRIAICIVLGSVLLSACATLPGDLAQDIILEPEPSERANRAMRLYQILERQAQTGRLHQVPDAVIADLTTMIADPNIDIIACETLALFGSRSTTALPAIQERIRQIREDDGSSQFGATTPSRQRMESCLRRIEQLE